MAGGLTTKIILARFNPDFQKKISEELKTKNINIFQFIEITTGCYFKTKDERKKTNEDK